MIDCLAHSYLTAKIQNIFDQTNQYYQDMSWNQFTITIEILPQVQIPISRELPNLNEVDQKTREIITSSGKVQGVDYDGVVTVYWKPVNGDMANGGGWGSVNGYSQWMTYYASSGLSYAVTRHEVGHSKYLYHL